MQNGGIVDFNITDPGMAIPNSRKLYPEVVDTERRLCLSPVDSDLRLQYTQISFGFIVDGLDTRLEENASLDGGFFVDANTTSGVLRYL